MKDFFVGLGVLFVIEGLTFAAFPEAMKKAMRSALEHSDTAMRVIGLSFAVAGLVVIWFLRFGHKML